MTCKEYNNDIRRIEPEKAKEKLDMPKWIYHLEESISRVRREINQINVLIKCKIEKQFTAHQKRLLKLVSAIFKRQMYFFVILNKVH